MLRSYLFGQLLLANDRVPLPRLATQKASSLLGYLLTSNDHLYTREYLGELFWPNRPSDNARRSLSTALWQIRQMLKQGGFDPARFLEASGMTVRWSPSDAVWLDAAEFKFASRAASIELLERAVSLYRGPFLEGLYDNWCIEERYRLEEEYLGALTRLAQLYRSERQFTQALDCARRILEIDPLREDACRAAMEALFQLGQRRAALERYEACARALKQDLNADPSQETRELYSAILNESLPRVLPGTRWPEPSSAAALSIPSAFTNLPIFNAGHVPFAGRAEELRRLHAWWSAGREPLALISGEAGVGKSRLTQELAASLRWSGVQVGWGRCYAFERALPYQSLAEALRGLFAATPSATLEALPPWVTAELVRLLPELVERLPREGASVAATADQTNLFEAVSRALDRLGQHEPVLIVLDDLHWSTESTQHLLEYLTRRPVRQANSAQPPLRLLATARPEELLTRDLRALIRGLRREELLADVNLGRLDLETVGDWIGHWSGRGAEAGPFAARIFQETEGNPFFVTELVKALFESGELQMGASGWEGAGLSATAISFPLPLSVRGLVQGRLERLSDPAKEALEVAAVAGREFDQNLLQAAWRRSEEETLTALDALLRAQLIRESTTASGRDYEFTHHKIQQIVHSGLSRGKRAALHRRVGEAAEAEYGEAAAVELLYHFRASADYDRAVTWGIKAGERARQLFAYHDALDYLSQAEALLKRTRVAPELEMALYAGLVGAYKELHLAERLIVAAQRLLELARQTHSRPREIEALAGLGSGLSFSSDPRAREVLEQACALAEQTQAAQLPEILYHLGVHIGWPGVWDEALPLLERATELGQRQGNLRLVARALNGIGIAWRAKGELGRSITAFEQGAALAEAAGERLYGAVLLQDLAEVYLWLELPNLFREHILRSHELFATLGEIYTEDIRLLGVMHHRFGNYAEARTLLQRAYELCCDRNDNDSLREVYQSYSLFLLESGEGEKALELAEEFVANAGVQYGARNPRPRFYRGLARLALGNLTAAEADLLPTVREWENSGGNRHFLWQGCAALGRLYVAQGKREPARAAFTRALELITIVADTLDDHPTVREGFLTSPPVRAIHAASNVTGDK